MRKASTNTCGFANSDTIEATTMIAMPHHNDHELTTCTRPNTAVPSASEPERGAISPIVIIHGTRIVKLTSMPMSMLEAVRMPMSPPAPNIAQSMAGRSPSWRMSTFAMRGTAAMPLSTRS